MATIHAVLVERSGKLQSLSLEQSVCFNPQRMAKQIGAPKEGFVLQTTWTVELEGRGVFHIELFGSCTVTAKQENKYEFPQPVDTKLFFGRCLLLNKDETSGQYVSLTKRDWQAIYDQLFEGFDDVAEEEEDDEDDDEEDGEEDDDDFIDDDDADDDDDDDDDDDEDDDEINEDGVDDVVDNDDDDDDDADDDDDDDDVGTGEPPEADDDSCCGTAGGADDDEEEGDDDDDDEGAAADRKPGGGRGMAVIRKKEGRKNES